MNTSFVKALIVAALLWANAVVAGSAERVQVILETRYGQVVLAIDTEHAPQAADYFMGYIDRGDYNGASLYRSASLDGVPPPQLVQGGLLAGALIAAQPVDPSEFGVSSLLTEWETTTVSGLRHTRGSISLARDLLDTGHVIPEIVFCLRDIPSMNEGGNGRPDGQGFPVIGEVLVGMNIIDAISQTPRDGTTSIPFLEGEILGTPVPITQAYRKQVIPTNAND